MILLRKIINNGLAEKISAYMYFLPNVIFKHKH